MKFTSINKYFFNTSSLYIFLSIVIFSSFFFCLINVILVLCRNTLFSYFVMIKFLLCTTFRSHPILSFALHIFKMSTLLFEFFNFKIRSNLHHRITNIFIIMDMVNWLITTQYQLNYYILLCLLTFVYLIIFTIVPVYIKSFCHINF